MTCVWDVRTTDEERFVIESGYCYLGRAVCSLHPWGNLGRDFRIHTENKHPKLR